MSWYICIEPSWSRLNDITNEDYQDCVLSLLKIIKKTLPREFIRLLQRQLYFYLNGLQEEEIVRKRKREENLSEEVLY